MNGKTSILLLGILNFTSLAVSAAPIGTAFTYQGCLKDGPSPASGSYELVFSLYDAITNGSRLAGPLTNTIAVNNGLFTVALDFGPGVFTGDAHWLEIGVRTNGSLGEFTVLSPRQPLTPAPYASFAVGAGSLPGYGASCLGASVLEYCVEGDVIECEPTLFVPVALQEGHELQLEGNRQPLVFGLRIRKTPRPGVPATGTYDVTVETSLGETTYTFTLAPDHPLANLQDDTSYTGDALLEAQLVSDELLLLRMDATAVKVITRESNCVIQSAQLQPYRASDRMAQLDVSVINNGNLRATYIVTVTDCGPTVAPVMAQSFTIEPNPTLSHKANFYLRTSGTFSDTNRCTVTLRSPTGKIYGKQIVTFPAPMGGDRK